MQCPVDGETLVMTDRSGVEIDYCPKCRGVWLDRGELDKIIERAIPAVPVQAVPVPEARRDISGRDQPSGRDSEFDRRRDYDDDDDDDHKYRRKKRSSFLGELFDF